MIAWERARRCDHVSDRINDDLLPVPPVQPVPVCQYGLYLANRTCFTGIHGTGEITSPVLTCSEKNGEDKLTEKIQGLEGGLIPDRVLARVIILPRWNR